MSLSGELTAAAEGSGMIAGQLNGSGLRQETAAAMVGATAETFPLVWVAPPADFIGAQLRPLYSAVQPVSYMFYEISRSMSTLADIAAVLAADARIWEAKAAAAQAELDRRSFLEQVGDSLFGGDDAAGQLMQAIAALEGIREQWNMACGSRIELIASSIEPLHTLENTSVILPTWPGLGVGSFEYQRAMADLVRVANGESPGGLGSNNLLEPAVDAWVWWQLQPVNTLWSWGAYMQWIRAGADPALLPTLVNSPIAKWLVQTGRASWLAAPWVQVGARTFPLVGGLFGIVTSGWRVLDSGWPQDAFRDRGAGYVADVGATILSAGVAGAAIVGMAGSAPAWVGGLVVGSIVVGGSLWIGSQVARHRDTIFGALGTAWDLTSSSVAWGWNRSGDGIGWLGDRLSDGRGWVGDRLGDGYGWLEDRAGDGLEAFDYLRDGASEVLGDLRDDAGDVLDAAGDLISWPLRLLP